MRVTQVLRLCRESAEKYLKYLKSKNKGRELIRATVLRENEGVFVFTLAKPLFSFDNDLLLNIDGKDYTQGEFLFSEYDQEKLLLFVRPSKESAAVFLREGHEIYVINDLTFLVSRILSFYSNLNNLHFPLQGTLTFDNSHLSDTLSEEQKEAVKCCLQQGQTYVWGAPGTGKTRYVLSNCLLTLLKDKTPKGKIIVLAPTNNALEQVLYGVLHELEKAGLSKDCVLRLGIPSHIFASQYPQICEAKGIEKQLKQIQDQIDLKHKIMEYKGFCSRYSLMEHTIIPLFEKAEDSLLELRDQKKTYSRSKIEFEEYCHQLESAQKLVKQNRIGLAILEERLEKVPFKGFPFLSCRKIKTIETEIAQKRKAIEEYDAICVKFQRLKTDALVVRNSIEQKIPETEKELNCILDSLQTALKSIPSLQGLASKLSLDTLLSSKAEANEKMNQGLFYIQANRSIYKEYDEIDSVTLQSQINELIETANQLQEESRQSKIGRASIVAATVDTFFGALSPELCAEQGIGISHIFLDEAGYCSLIKGILLTAYNCPITMLGDHMQLPPVCEMDREEIHCERDNRPVILWSASAIYMESVFVSPSFDALYEGLYKNAIPSTKDLIKTDLTKTYRFDGELAAILDKCVYHNGFSSAKTRSPITIQCLDAPYIAGVERHQSRAEAEKISQIIGSLEDENYAILTPYRNQRKLIQELSGLNSNEKSQKILTVHASQGREWNTVILSIADPSAGWFTNTKKTDSGALQLINTAVSRTKKNLIIVCNKSYWENQEGQFLSELIHHSTTR